MCVTVASAMSSEPRKLVIGTRHWLGADWDHLDADGTALISDDGFFHYPEVIGDARSVPRPDGSYLEVYSQECLEHFPWASTAGVVKEWARLVVPGGELRIEVPDFIACCEQLIAHDSLDMDLRMQQLFFGGQVNRFDYHYAGLTHRTLVKFIEDAGLSVIEVKRGWQHGWLMVRGRRATRSDATR